jgi:hypothetical protein
MGERRQNIRQVEMGERMDELFNLACEGQKDLMERQEEHYRGIPREIFLAKYRIGTKVGVYASERYFRDYKTIGTFIDGEEIVGIGLTFKVAEKPYQIWLKENYPEETNSSKIETKQKLNNQK